MNIWWRWARTSWLPFARICRHGKGLRLVWGLKDQVFGVQWAEWLDRTLPNSRGLRRIEDAKLFFPEEMQDIIAEEAKQLWNA
jgi:haloalkane dehalogenase